MPQVAGTFYTYLELKECRPRLRRLDRLLAAEPFRGRLSPGRGYSRPQLADAVQASHTQLETALRGSHAMLMDGERGRCGDGRSGGCLLRDCLQLSCCIWVADGEGDNAAGSRDAASLLSSGGYHKP